MGEALDEKRQHALIEEFFSGVKSGKVTVLEGAAISRGFGRSDQRVAADCRREGERAVDMLSKLGDTATVTFRVDPGIMGGLVVRVGDKVLDGSVAGQLEGLRTSLK